MGFFDSAEKKAILKTRENQHVILKREPGYYEALNKLAKTYLDEIELPETKPNVKSDCLETAVKTYEASVKASSLELAPYLFLYDHYTKTKPELAYQIEEKGLDFLIFQREQELFKANMVLSTARREDLNFDLVYFCERFTRRTNVQKFKEKLTKVLGGSVYQNLMQKMDDSGILPQPI